jgi:diamine N-acetyltransferase
MTFYNIIFGILFLGAFREVVSSLATGPDWNKFCLTATLSVLIFSDTIYTSMVIEGRRNTYSVLMKLLDLTSFILLSFAVVVVDPTKENMFQVDAACRLESLFGSENFKREGVFWMLLSLYAIVLILWNVRAGVYRNLKQHRWVTLVQPLLVVFFALMAVLCFTQDEEYILKPARVALLVISLIYLVGYKPFLTCALDSVVLKPLTADDAFEIQSWPHYPPRVAALDYALRQGGWLDMFPESPTTRRFAAWQQGKLVGFSILTGNKTDAEFYIAVHPERLKEGLGRKITNQTLALGFKKHGLRRIYLKVRDWYTEAIRLYESVGFHRFGTHVEVTNGVPVNFIMMQKSW